MPLQLRIALCAWGGVLFLAVLLTVYDKIAAKRWPRHRIREATLLTVAALGGAISMLLTMQLIRHKTKHASFMLGLPFFILLHCILAWLLYYFGYIGV